MFMIPSELVGSVSSFSCTHSGGKSASDKKAGVWPKGRRKHVSQEHPLWWNVKLTPQEALETQSNNEVYLT